MNQSRAYRVTLELTGAELVAMQALFPSESISGMVQGALGYYLSCAANSPRMWEAYKKISGAFCSVDKVVVLVKKSEVEL